MFQREQLRKRRRILDAYRPFVGCCRCGRTEGVKLVICQNDFRVRRCRRDLQRDFWDKFWADLMAAEVYCASCSNHSFWKRTGVKPISPPDLHLTNTEIAVILGESVSQDDEQPDDLFADV